MTNNLSESTITKATAASAPGITNVIINRGRLHAAFRAVEQFMSQDETRFHLCATYMEILPGPASGLRLVATDGHTLARVTIPCVVDGPAPKGTLLRSPSVEAAIKMLKCTKQEAKQDVALKIGGVSVALHVDSGVCSLWVVDATFPPYAQVIPDYDIKDRNRKTRGTIGMNPAYLARACEAVARFGRAANSTHGAVITLGSNELDPALVEFADGDLGQLTIVIMPMRLE